jgi:hypothetical protein
MSEHENMVRPNPMDSNSEDRAKKIVLKNISLNRIYLLELEDGRLDFFENLGLCPPEVRKKVLNISDPKDKVKATKLIANSIEMGWAY